MAPRVKMSKDPSLAFKKAVSRFSVVHKELAKSKSTNNKENEASNDAAPSPDPVDGRPTPLDFELFFPWVCQKMATDGDIQIIKKNQEKVNKKHIKIMESTESDEFKNMASQPKSDSDGSHRRRVIPMQATYDPNGLLVELIITANDFLTQKHFKILKICLTFQPSMSKIIVTKCKLNQGVLYEIGQLVAPTHIVELILDDTRCKHGNFYALLEVTTCLKRLSLNRCKINDAIVIELFKRVQEPLQILELSNNFITDKGIRALGNKLRTNRSLIHINLAGNAITDDGASRIFNTLKKFELTKDEIYEFRRRRLSYCEKRQICFNEQMKMAETRGTAKSGPQMTKKNAKAVIAAQASTFKSMKLKKGESITTSAAVADKITRQIVGPFEDVFDEDHVELENDRVFCHGNFRLSSLNLAYNNISHIGMTQILSVLEYQDSPLVPATMGLVRIMVNGNNLCVECDVQETITNYIKKKMMKFCKPDNRPGKKT